MHELCARLKCSESNVRRLIAEHHFPPPFLFGRSPCWWEADVVAYEHLLTRGAFAPRDGEDWGEEDEEDPPPRKAPGRPRPGQGPPISS